jgi:hypothetical protein
VAGFKNQQGSHDYEDENLMPIFHCSEYLIVLRMTMFTTGVKTDIHCTLLFAKAVPVERFVAKIPNSGDMDQILFENSVKIV